MNAILRGQLTTIDDIRRFIEAGHAILTLVSEKTKTRYTYRFDRPDPKEWNGAAVFGVTRTNRERPIWVKVLDGPDNVSNYRFIGTFWKLDDGQWEYRRSAKVTLGDTAPSLLAVKWFMRQVYKPGPVQGLFEMLEVWHEGRCGRCGRLLTVPESVERGFGPECAGILGV